MEAIDRTRLTALIAEGATVLDVLPAASYRRSHIRGARSLPLTDFAPASLASLDRAKPVVVYCNVFT